MKIFRWVFLLIFFAVPVHAQDCDSLVVDQAGVMDTTHAEQIRAEAQSLINEGADVRVRTVGQTDNLDTDEKQLESACPSWRAPDGSRKSTLVALMVSPSSRKMGIYYGAAWHHALDDHWNRIKQDYMTPHFRTGDWSGGFIAAEHQLADRIQASQDEALHPAVSTTVNQATDLSGLWSVLKWILLLGSLGLAIFLWIGWQIRRRKAYQERREARANAINAKSQASNLLSVTPKDQPGMDAALQEFARLDSLVKSDPYADNLETVDYKAIGFQYRRVSDMVMRKESDPPPTTEEPSPEQPTKKNKKGHRRSVRYGDSGTVYHDTTTVIPIPIQEPEPRWEPDPEPSRSSSSSDSDSGGGGSSSWSDSNSDSGGGSSDFGGGGGDSGGGGGSSSF